MEGIDCKIHDEPDAYRRAVAQIKYDPLSQGALVTTHKIDLLNANVVDVTTSDGYMAITVIDETVAGTVQVSLIFGTDTKELAQWSLVEPSGAELTFSLFDVEKDVEIPRAFFSIPATFKPLEQ